MTHLTAPKPRGSVLLLHGWFSDGGRKHATLNAMGLKVNKPALSNWSLKSAIRTAQQAHDLNPPDVIVGSSRGAAVAMRLAGDTPLILLSPPFLKRFVCPALKKKVIMIQGIHDRWINPDDTVEYCRRNNDIALFLVDDDHQLNGPEGIEALGHAVSLMLAQIEGDFWERKANEKMR